MIAPTEALRDPSLSEKVWFILSSRSEMNEAQFFFAVTTITVLLIGVIWRTWRLHRAQRTDHETTAKWLRYADRGVSAALIVLALCSGTAYFYGQRNVPNPKEEYTWHLHRWDMYHQIIGAKYFTEVGYFRIYECTWEIDEANAGHFRRVPEMRDIRTLKILPTQQVIGERDCADLFTDPARLAQFAKDIDDIYALGGGSMWTGLFKDKGFNGTPFHAFVLAKLTAHVEIVHEELLWLALLDVFWMSVAFCMVWWAWDAKTAAIAVLCFCMTFPNRFVHMGGSILRFDYVAMLIIALALMKKDRFAAAGVCVAWAAAERVFPAVFAVGLGLKAGIELVATRKLRREYLHFGIAFVAGLCVLFCLSLTMGETLAGGFDHWQDWWSNMKIHTRHTRGFRVGFKHMFMMDGNVTDNHRFMGWSKKTAMFHTRDHYYYLSLVLLFAPLVIAARKLDAVTFTALFAAAGFFTLTIATRYYYSMMVLFVLVDRELFEDRKQMLLVALLCLTSAWLIRFAEAATNVPFHYNTASSAALAAWFVILGAVLWMDPWLRDAPAGVASTGAPEPEPEQPEPEQPEPEQPEPEPPG